MRNIRTSKQFSLLQAQLQQQFVFDEFVVSSEKAKRQQRIDRNREDKEQYHAKRRAKQ